MLMPEGCAYLIRRELFEALGRFDPEFFMFADEFDLSWRVWISGHRAMAVPSARLHHRGAAQVNPAGGGATVEFRTSDTKRFYANRNSLLVLLKNARHLLLLLVPLQLGLLLLEGLVSLALRAAVELCEASILGRRDGLLAAPEAHPGRAPADPAVPPPGRSVDAAVPALAIEPVGRGAAFAPLRRAEGDPALIACVPGKPPAIQE